MNSRSVRLTRGPISQDNANALAMVCAALADPVRLRLFDLVRRAGPQGICSCDLTEPLGRSQPTISHHLKVLRESGLVESRRDGTWIWYSMTATALTELSGFIQ